MFLLLLTCFRLIFKNTDLQRNLELVVFLHLRRNDRDGNWNHIRSEVGAALVGDAYSAPVRVDVRPNHWNRTFCRPLGLDSLSNLPFCLTAQCNCRLRAEYRGYGPGTYIYQRCSLELNPPSINRCWVEP